MTRRLRVAIVAPTSAILGGHSVQADAMRAGWAADPEVEAWLVPINPAAPRLLRPLAHAKYLRTFATQSAYWPLLCRELARADVVHVFSAAYTSFLLSPLPAMVVARWFRRPVLLNYHSGEAPDHLRRSRLARRAIARAHLTVVPSSYLAEVFRAEGLRAEVIPNTIDRARFRFRRRRPLRPHLLSTRNLEPLYNVACTLRAFQRIQARVPDATLTVVGTGSQDAALRRLTRELSLDRVTFLGRVPPAAMPAVYAAADLYVQTPDVDNMPLSVLEAFASGLPVISTEAGGVPAMLTHEVHGLLAPLDDDDSVARAAIRLLEDAPLAERLAGAAFETTEACAWPAVRARWLAAYRRLHPSASEVGVPVGAT